MFYIYLFLLNCCFSLSSISSFSSAEITDWRAAEIWQRIQGESTAVSFWRTYKFLISQEAVSFGNIIYVDLSSKHFSCFILVHINDQWSHDKIVVALLIEVPVSVAVFWIFSLSWRVKLSNSVHKLSVFSRALYRSAHVRDKHFLNASS